MSEPYLHRLLLPFQDHLSEWVYQFEVLYQAWTRPQHHRCISKKHYQLQSLVDRKKVDRSSFFAAQTALCDIHFWQPRLLIKLSLIGLVAWLGSKFWQPWTIKTSSTIYVLPASPSLQFGLKLGLHHCSHSSKESVQTCRCSHSGFGALAKGQIYPACFQIELELCLLKLGTVGTSSGRQSSNEEKIWARTCSVGSCWTWSHLWISIEVFLGWEAVLFFGEMLLFQDRRSAWNTWRLLSGQLRLPLFHSETLQDLHRRRREDACSASVQLLLEKSGLLILLGFSRLQQ